MTTASPSSVCPACGASAVEGGVCARCGYAQGESNRCPHCGSIARVEPRGEGERAAWVCAVCGGPRIPGNVGGAPAEAALRDARRLGTRATRSRAVAFAWTLLALLPLAPALLVTSLAPQLVLLALTTSAAFLALRANTASRRARAGAAEAEERAWLAAAERVVAASGAGLTAPDLASKLRVDPARADHLLTQLAVHERTRVDVGDDAQVRYSVGPTVRVDEELAQDAQEDEERAEARARAEIPR